MTPNDPAAVARATNNLLSTIQTRIQELRREADSLERDVQTIMAANQPQLPPPEQRGANAVKEPTAAELAEQVRAARGDKPKQDRNGSAPAGTSPAPTPGA